MCNPTSAFAAFLLAGLFVTVLLLSIFFASRLRPASRAPLLFRPDTNIQVLLDLKYNLSAEGISCVTCSGEMELASGLLLAAPFRRCAVPLPLGRGPPSLASADARDPSFPD